MRSKLLIMSTAALLAGTLAAASQNIQPGGAGGAGGAAQEKGQQGGVKGSEAPKAGQMQRESQGGLKGQTQGQAERVQDNAKGKTQGQAERVQDNPKGKTQGQAERDQDKSKIQTQGDKSKIQTQGQNQRDQDRVQGREQDRTQQGEREGRSSNTSVSFTSEQRTKIRETVFKEKNAPRVSKVDFSLNVGTVVPRTVHIVEVPDVIVTVHPEWRGFRYFIVNDEIVVVEPDTLKIVAVIDV